MVSTFADLSEKIILEKPGNISVIPWDTFEEIQFPKVSTIIINTGKGVTGVSLPLTGHDGKSAEILLA